MKLAVHESNPYSNCMPRKRRQLKPSSYQVIMDWWVAIGVVMVVLFLVISLPVVVWSSLPIWEVALAVLLLTCTILSLVDVAFFTYYILSEEGLVITSQLRRYVIPFCAMTSVRSVGIKGLITFARRKRFSLSARGYDISLDEGPWRVISVSPDLRDTFLDTLLSRIDRERSQHATVEV